MALPIHLKIARAVIILSLLPSGGVPFWHADKIAHFLAYAVMAVLALSGFRSRLFRPTALFCAVGLGTLLEWAQSFVPGRDMSLIDGIANTLGVFSGSLLFHLRGEDWVERIFSSRFESGAENGIAKEIEQRIDALSQDIGGCTDQGHLAAQER